MTLPASTCDTPESRLRTRNALRTASPSVTKPSRSRRILRILGRDTSRCQSRPFCNACVRCLPHRRKKARPTNLNVDIPLVTDSQATLVDDATPLKASFPSSLVDVPQPSVKRKHLDVTPPSAGPWKSSAKKRQRREGTGPPSQGTLDDARQDSSVHSSAAPGTLSKIQKEKQRQREKKKRQKAAKHLKADEHRVQLELEARRAEESSYADKRFLVRFPLDRVSELSGRSVSRNFRKADLDLNDITPVSLQVVFRCKEALAVYQCLRRPLIFDRTCAKRIEILKRDLKDVEVSSMFMVHQSHPSNVATPSNVEACSMMQPPILDSGVLDAIEHVLKDTSEPHHMESSQNAEEKIKSLFKPVLQSIGLKDILVTNGFAWREKIGLRSTIDLRTHEYAPKSDVAIVQVLDDENARILVVFEAYSKAGQSHATPDENRADRVRLLIQGSYISRKELQPSVVFYLTRDKQMETIIIFPREGATDWRQFHYFAEKQPFYSKASWARLLCQVMNLVWAWRDS